MSILEVAHANNYKGFGNDNIGEKRMDAVLLIILLVLIAKILKD